jgi:4'-phosphopantetheinyl transferase
MTRGEAEVSVKRLPANERERFHRYRHTLASHEFLVGRLLVRGWLEAVSGIAAGEWQFTEGERGRPGIAHPASPWSFNLAHSGGMVACALSLLPDIGVDLEDLNRRPLSRDLFRRYCSPAEVADIESQPEQDQMRRFLTYWTLKEAYLKARGLGIAVHLADVEFSVSGPRPSVTFKGSLEGSDAGWAFALFQPSPRCLLSIAVPQPDGTPPPAIDVRALPLEALTSR